MNQLIEARIISYLEAETKIPTYAEVPEQNKGSFFVVERIGARAENHVDTYTIAVQSYADTLLDAAVLSTIARHYMEDMISDPDIASVRFNTDYNFTDTTTKRYRYQALFDITEL